MTLSESYSRIKGSIVGFAPAYFPQDQPAPRFPEIFATGFVIREDGLIATNHHVVRFIVENVIANAPEVPPNRSPCIAVICKYMRDYWLHANLQVLNYALIDAFVPGQVYYGPNQPDIAFVQVKASGLPTVDFDDSVSLEEGIEIATAGYPLGSDLLTAPGYLHQVTPTLRKGIISAVLPFPSPNPHAFIIDHMSQGGASGSPVFLPDTANVIGMLYAGFEDTYCTSTERPHSDNNPPHRHLVTVPTNMSYVVPSRLIVALMKTNSIRNLTLPDDAEHVDAIFERQLRTIPA
jgi:S1-C subfamily serine protease